MRSELTQTPSLDLLMHFGQLPRYHSFALAENLVSVFQRCGKTMRRFVENERARHRSQLIEAFASRIRPRRQEAPKEKLVSWQAGSNQCGDQRTWTREWNDCDVILDCRAYETK